MRVNPAWVDEIERRFIETPEGQVFKVNTTFQQQAQAVILMLLRHKKVFKIYNLGAGIKQITTEIEKCPLCKQKL
jgi:hypothetical protein